MTLTTDEAALLVGVKPATIRQWVKRGYLVPLNASYLDAMRFHEWDITKCAYDRRPKTVRLAHQAAATRWRELLDILDTNCHTKP